MPTQDDRQRRRLAARNGNRQMTDAEIMAALRPTPRAQAHTGARVHDFPAPRRNPGTEAGLQQRCAQRNAASCPPCTGDCAQGRLCPQRLQAARRAARRMGLWQRGRWPITPAWMAAYVVLGMAAGILGSALLG